MNILDAALGCLSPLRTALTIMTCAQDCLQEVKNAPQELLTLSHRLNRVNSLLSELVHAYGEEGALQSGAIDLQYCVDGIQAEAKYRLEYVTSFINRVRGSTKHGKESVKKLQWLLHKKDLRTALLHLTNLENGLTHTISSVRLQSYDRSSANAAAWGNSLFVLRRLPVARDVDSKQNACVPNPGQPRWKQFDNTKSSSSGAHRQCRSCCADDCVPRVTVSYAHPQVPLPH
jgi:hypothetical protein